MAAERFTVIALAEPITLILLVAAGDGAAPVTAAMTRATRDALESAPVQVVETRDLPTDDEAVALERDARAAAVVELRWLDSARRRATLRVHLAAGGRWIERSFGFAASDATTEQGRTLGFAVASMFPAPSDPKEATPAPGGGGGGSSVEEGTDAAATPGAAATAPEPTVPPKASPATPEAPAPAAAGATEAPAPAPPLSLQERRSTASFALEIVAMGVTGEASGPGGSAAIEWFAVPWLAARAAGGVYESYVVAAQATAQTAFGSAAVLVQPWKATRRHPFGASVRGEYLVSRVLLTHFDNDEAAPIARVRWLSGVGGFVDGEWLFASDAEAVLGAGLRGDFGTTEVYDKGARVDTISPVRAVVEAGVGFDSDSACEGPPRGTLPAGCLRSGVKPRRRLRIVPDAEAPAPVASPKPTLDDSELLACVPRRGPLGGNGAARPDAPAGRPTAPCGASSAAATSTTTTSPQQALIELVTTIDRYRGDCSLDSWASAITAHVVYKHLRRRKTERRIFGALDADFLAAQRSPSRTGRDAMLRSAVRGVLAHLDAMDEAKAWTFVLHDVCGYDVREIAQITGVSAAAAQTRLVRGRREVHELIANDPDLAQLLESTEVDP